MSGRRDILGRLAMLVAGFSAGIAILAGAEIFLRVAGIGADRPRLDPFAGYSLAAPNFVPAERPDGMHV